MRTPEQLANLRLVLSVVIGPCIMFMPDSMIDLWADKVQKKIDQEKEVFWVIKVRMDNDIRLWSELDSEPVHPFASATMMSRSILKLFERFFMISAVSVYEEDNPENCYLFKRQKEVPKIMGGISNKT